MEKITTKTKFRNVTIEPIEHPKFTNMVKITKAKKAIYYLVGKQYIDINKAKVAIDYALSEVTVKRPEKVIKKELEGIVIESPLC